jgi:hypothetical protein
MGGFSELAAMQGKGLLGPREQMESWKLLISVGDGRYFRMDETYVGVGDAVRLSWEARMEDSEDGVLVPFIWAVMRRCFGASSIVAKGEASPIRPLVAVRLWNESMLCLSRSTLPRCLRARPRPGGWLARPP